MEMGNLIITVLVTSIIIIGMSSFYTDLLVRQGIQPQNLAVLNKTEKIVETQNIIYENLKGNEGIFSFVNVPLAIITGGVAAIQLILFTVPDILITMISEILHVQGIGIAINPSIVAILSALVISIFIFAVLGVFFGRKV